MKKSTYEVDTAFDMYMTFRVTIEHSDEIDEHEIREKVWEALNYDVIRNNWLPHAPKDGWRLELNITSMPPHQRACKIVGAHVDARPERMCNMRRLTSSTGEK